MHVLDIFMNELYQAENVKEIQINDYSYDPDEEILHINVGIVYSPPMEYVTIEFDPPLD